MTKVTSADLLKAARAEINHLSVADAQALQQANEAVLVDIRDSKELEAGAITGAIHAPRGGLEFALDPASGMGMPALLEAPHLIMVCGSGGRAALATKLAQDMGHNASCLDGGFKAWSSQAAS